MCAQASLKAVVYPELARVAKALASPHRLQLLELLSQAERSVETLAELCGQPVGTVSHHLKVLRHAHLVETRRDGVFIHYRAVPAGAALWNELCNIGATAMGRVQDTLRKFVAAPDEFQPKSVAAVQRQIAKGEILLIDVRPHEEFAAAHFPGAVSMPIAELESKIAGLRKGTEVVAYCRGPYCLMSDTAVRALRQRGFRARRWTAGVPDWVRLGVRLDGTPRDSKR